MLASGSVGKSLRCIPGSDPLQGPETMVRTCFAELRIVLSRDCQPEAAVVPAIASDSNTLSLRICCSCRNARAPAVVQAAGSIQ